MQAVHIDFETCSDLDLKKCGAFAYAVHPSTDILCLAWQRPGEAVSVWFPGEPLPPMAEHFSAWNATFEWLIWNAIGVRRYGFPPRSRECFDNPQARAMAHNMPASLDGAAAALNLPVRKDMAGKKLMQKMAKRQDITPENLQRLGKYCVQDVAVEVAVNKRLRTYNLTPDEQAVYTLSEEINARGVLIDREYVQLAAQAAADYQGHVAKQMVKRYGFGPRQVQEITAFCARAGVPMEDLRADTVESTLLLGELLPEPVVDVLQMRQKAAAAAPGKYAAMLRAVSPDDRLRGMFSYCGATQTGRWSGRIVQLHNLARPTMEKDYALAYMDILRRERTWEALGDDPLEVLLNTLRPSLMAPAGGVLTAGDEAAIEARVIAWLAGCEPVLTVFANGGDIYLHAAESIYHKPVTKADKAERQIGKVATLALGFGGGKGAFITMGRGYGVQVAETEAEQIKVEWRKSHPEYVMLWTVLEHMASAVTPGKPPNHEDWRGQVDPVVLKHVEDNLRDIGIEFRHDGFSLFCRLPSGRELVYPGARMRLSSQSTLYNYFRTTKGQTHEEAMANSYRHRLDFFSPEGDRMVKNSTYGGKLSENLTQAIARDVLAHAMLKMRHEPIVMHVHDEIVVEADRLDEVKAAMESPPDWTLRGVMPLPLAAEVNTLERYWK
jgi:DNA polymerase